MNINVAAFTAMQKVYYVHIPFEYLLHGTFTRKVWIYEEANYELFNKNINLILIDHAFIKVLSMKHAYSLLIFSLNWLYCVNLVKLL